MADLRKAQPVSFSNDVVKGMRTLNREQHYELKQALRDRGDKTPDEVLTKLREKWGNPIAPF